jgi:aminoglycoside/choline kinase family phosphotransferase
MSDPLDSLARWVHRHTGRDDPVVAVPMPGGASTRRFYRVELGDQSAVAMYVPDGTRSEEVTRSDGAARRWPFLEVRDLLAARGVRVPRLLGEACEDGWMVVEDLGDDTLSTYLARHPAERERLYRQAVADLARAQNALATLPGDSIVAARAFDYELLHWEIQHFREWALEARGLRLVPADRAVFDRAAESLARRIAGWPRVFVHRDYQSRNLMVVPLGSGEVELAWVDFQDALLGPRVYDLVALLSDSYQEFTPEFEAARLDEYVAQLALDASERPRIAREFDLVTVQRKLKDAGRFVFIDRVKGNPGYLEFVDPTIAKVRVSLGRLRDDAELVALDQLLGRVLA